MHAEETEEAVTRQWKLTDDDRSTLSALADAIRGLTDMARDGQDLIAIGEVLDAFERIERGEEVEVNVGLDVGFRRGDRDFQEGLYACLRIDREGVDLSEVNTSYSSDAGSDRSSRRFAYLGPRGRFDGAGVHSWLELLGEIRQEEETRLSTSRDHV
jgi:flavin-binding protein dodecin